MTCCVLSGTLNSTLSCAKRMHIFGTNEEGKSREQPTEPASTTWLPKWYMCRKFVSIYKTVFVVVVNLCAGTWFSAEIQTFINNATEMANYPTSSVSRHSSSLPVSCFFAALLELLTKCFVCINVAFCLLQNLWTLEIFNYDKQYGCLCRKLFVL